MDDARKLQQAKQVYETCLKAFNDRGWNYSRDDEKMKIECTVRGDDLPIEFRIRVLPQLMVLQLLSNLPCKMKDDKMIEGAVATSYVNYNLNDGNFDFDMKTGSIIFRLTSSYRDSLISKELINYMIDLSTITIDDYNEKFFALSSNMMNMEQFLDAVNKV